MAWLKDFPTILGDNIYLQAGIIVVAAFILAKVSDWVLCGLVRKLTRRTDTSLDDQLIDIMHRPIFMLVVLMGLGMATNVMVLGKEELAIAQEAKADTGLSEGYAYFILSVLKTIGILVGLVFTMRLSSLLLGFISRHQDKLAMVQPRTLPLFNNLAKLLIFVAALYFTLLAWGGNPSGLVASAGILGLALSFAAKDTLANLFAGVAIVADAPYKVGDFVVLDSGERGAVTNIGIRSTRLLTRDDVEVTIPNGVMGNARIINESGGPHVKYRIKIKVGVAYGVDIDKVREVLTQVASDSDQVCAQPEPRIRFRSFGDSALLFELQCWINEPMLRGRVTDALNTQVYKRFLAAGIEIPYAKQDLYIKEMPKR